MDITIYETDVIRVIRALCRLGPTSPSRLARLFSTTTEIITAVLCVARDSGYASVEDGLYYATPEGKFFVRA